MPRAAMNNLRGKFIVFDGGEGCGKTTQARLLREHLEGQGLPVLAVHDPGATRIGEMVRAILLNPENNDMAMRCEMLLYMASRAQMMVEKILPALKAGSVVVSDRFVSSTLAYQLGGDGLTAREIRDVAEGSDQGALAGPDADLRSAGRIKRRARPAEVHALPRRSRRGIGSRPDRAAIDGIPRRRAKELPRAGEGRSEAIQGDQRRAVGRAGAGGCPSCGGGFEVTTLQDIFGQDAAIDVITRAYEADRLPHSMIFAGPIGVGKATTARALGRLFLCTNSKKGQPCGKCKSCELMQSSEHPIPPNHPGYHVIYRQLSRIESEKSKAIELSVLVIRERLIRPANHTQMSEKSDLNQHKVFVVEEADLMTPSAQNALLKTLEEPVKDTLIILLTDQPHALLPTIRSRCQIVRFGPLETKVVERELAKRKIDKPTAAEAAKLAEGSLGVAMKWVEDGVVTSARDLIKRLDAILNGKPAGDLADWFKKAADAYAEKQLERDKLSSKDQATREALAIYLKIASNHFRTQLAELPENPDALESACVAIDVIARAENYLDSNVNVALTFQQLAASLEREFAPLSPASR